MKTKVIITVVIALLSSVMAWKLYANKQVINDHKEVKTTEESVSVTVATAKLKETSGTLQLVGTAEPSREVMVASEASGKIVQINFKMGDCVLF